MWHRPRTRSTSWHRRGSEEAMMKMNDTIAVRPRTSSGWLIFIVVPLCIVVVLRLYRLERRPFHAGQYRVHQAAVYLRACPAASCWPLIATVICLVHWRIPLAIILSRMRGYQQQMMLMLIMLPMWMNFLLRTYAWMTLLERQRPHQPVFSGLFGLGPCSHDQHLTARWCWAWCTTICPL